LVTVPRVAADAGTAYLVLSRLLLRPAPRIWKALSALKLFVP
jgi:hypothetical protein